MSTCTLPIRRTFAPRLFAIGELLIAPCLRGGWNVILPEGDSYAFRVSFRECRARTRARLKVSV